MDSWLSTPSAVLWCRFRTKEQARGHRHPAACILRQALSSEPGGSWHAFSYVHQRTSEVRLSLPPQFLDAKAENQDQSAPQNDHLKIEEIILLSFLVQARKKGLPVHLDDIDLSKRTIFISSLVSVLIKALQSIPGRVFFVVENLNHGAADVLKVMQGLSVALTSLHCRFQVIISAVETPDSC